MSEAQPLAPAPSKAALWTGRIISALPVLGFSLSGAMKLSGSPDVVDGMGKLGWPADYAVGLGILELGCTLVYLVPQTAVLGAILLTGYLGGAIATHVRIGDFGLVPHVILGMLIWLGVYLRDPRLRALVPLRW